MSVPKPRVARGSASAAAARSGSGNTGPAEQDRSCCHGYLFLSSLAPRAQENCAIIPYFGWEKRDENGGRGQEWERNGIPNAYIIQICSHLPSFHTFCQFPPFSPSLSRAVLLSLSLSWVNTFSNNSHDDASLCW